MKECFILAENKDHEISKTSNAISPVKIIPSKLNKSSSSSVSTVENCAGKNYEQLAWSNFEKRTHLWNRTISLSSESNTNSENNYINEYLTCLKDQIKRKNTFFLREDLREKNVPLK